MDLLSRWCSLTPVNDISDNTLKPEASYWKLVLEQRLQVYFDQSEVEFPNYMRESLKKSQYEIVENPE